MSVLLATKLIQPLNHLHLQLDIINKHILLDKPILPQQLPLSPNHPIPPIQHPIQIPNLNLPRLL